MPKGKTGPKPKPMSERRRNRIMLNLTDDEYRRLVKAAGGHENATLYVRELLVQHMDRLKR